MNFKKEQNKRKNEIDQIVIGYLPEAEGFQKTVLDAMNYSVSAGGKRIRPMLMQETYRLFGGDHKVIEPFMAAIEMIHTYSLVHDDLPCMDDDDYRRGRKTTHKVYGEGMAVLTGDALLNYAFETACEAFEMEPGNPAVGKAITILARKAGIFGMIGGQTADIEAAGTSIAEDKLEFIYQLKTSALVESAMMIGAVLAGADAAETDIIEQAAREIGLAFQIQDDILDVTSTIEELGKPINSDEKNEKTTYVTLKGLQDAKREAAEVSVRAKDRIASLGRDNTFLEQLIEALVERKN